MQRSFAIPMVLALAASATAMANAPSEKPVDQTTDVAASSIISIDPATGRLRAATEEEAAALSAETARAAAAQALLPKPPLAAGQVSAPKTEAEAVAGMKRLPNGVIKIDVPESLYSTSTATVGANGEIVVSHGEATAEETIR